LGAKYEKDLPVAVDFDILGSLSTGQNVEIARREGLQFVKSSLKYWGDKPFSAL